MLMRFVSHTSKYTLTYNQRKNQKRIDRNLPGVVPTVQSKGWYAAKKKKKNIVIQTSLDHRIDPSSCKVCFFGVWILHKAAISRIQKERYQDKFAYQAFDEIVYTLVVVAKMCCRIRIRCLRVMNLLSVLIELNLVPTVPLVPWYHSNVFEEVQTVALQLKYLLLGFSAGGTHSTNQQDLQAVVSQSSSPFAALGASPSTSIVSFTLSRPWRTLSRSAARTNFRPLVRRLIFFV